MPNGEDVREKAQVAVVAALLVGVAAWLYVGSRAAEPAAAADPVVAYPEDVFTTPMDSAYLWPSDGASPTETRASLEQRLLDTLREQSYSSVDLPSVGEERLGLMSDQAFDAHMDELLGQLRVVQRENLAAATVVVDEFAALWPRQECPGDGSVDESIFDGALSDTIGIDAFDALPGFEVTHSADISLANGVAHFSRSSFDDGWSVDLETPGRHPLFAATAIWERREYVSFAQLVVAPGDPVMWVEEERFFLEAEYGSLWIGSEDSYFDASFDLTDEIERLAYRQLIEELTLDRSSSCDEWAHADGRNIVRQSASFDGSFPAYVAYDAAGTLLAITWDFGEVYRSEATTSDSDVPIPTPAGSAGSAVEAEL